MSLLLLLRAWTVLVELHAADRAAIMLFDPVANAVAAESMLAWEFNTFCTFLALVKADVAVSFFACLLRGQISDELLGAAICRCWALRSHTHAQALATEDLI